MSKLIRHANSREFAAGNTRLRAVAVLLRDGIVSAWAKWVTPKDAPRGEPAPSHSSVLFKRFDRVRRAAGHVPAARGEHRRKRHLIPANEQNENRTHESIYCVCLHNDSRSFSIDAVCQLGELGKAQSIRRRPSVDDHVHHGQPWEDDGSCQLAKTAFQQVTLDRRLSVLRDDEPNTGVPSTRKGSAHPNVEMFGAKALPCSRDLPQLGATRDAMTARKCRCRTRLIL